MLDRIGPSLNWVKIGLQLYLRHGNPLIEAVARRGYRIFLDLKLHDIPNTVASAINSLADLPCHMLTLHAAGGAEMMERAGEAARACRPDWQLLAVTVLTSMNATQLQSIGVSASPEEQVLQLAALARSSGLNGLVCSPLEITPIHQQHGNALTLVTPGIRPANSDTDEQKRIMTPREAVDAGARFLVIGRPILKAADPVAVIHSIQTEIA